MMRIFESSVRTTRIGPPPSISTSWPANVSWLTLKGMPENVSQHIVVSGTLEAMFWRHSWIENEEGTVGGRVGLELGKKYIGRALGHLNS